MALGVLWLVLAPAARAVSINMCHDLGNGVYLGDAVTLYHQMCHGHPACPAAVLAGGGGGALARAARGPGAAAPDQLGPVTCQNVDEPPENVSGVNEFLLVWQPKWPLNYGELLQRLPVVKRALGDVADRGGERWVLALPLARGRALGAGARALLAPFADDVVTDAARLVDRAYLSLIHI